MDTIKVSYERLNHEHSKTHGLAQDWESLDRQINYPAQAVRWTGDSYQSYHEFWVALQRVMGEIGASLETMSACLEEASYVYSETDNALAKQLHTRSR
ncbi:WXG100 family type VII secretion target [Tumebacillus permanentifrigoris]|uniref:Uncharacterized protein n=1 Tax=Tumebacillus permanentifrigoris TaxID=378543 RepID=A0A316D965_9BACL|nr:hypothetical protein [Tumebacillus permanentifrigoris]PWK13516.1 hypothetical protein C7459_107185 [Tumebacillus permanentifrigoris]